LGKWDYKDMVQSSIKVNPSTNPEAVDVPTDKINGIDYPVYKDVILNASEGKDPNYRVVDKFGSSLNVTAAGFTVISHGDAYQTPVTAQALEFVSGNAGDALNGAGMWEIVIEGLDATWNLTITTVSAHATDGTIAVLIPGTWMRVFRAKVSASGTYATLTDPSHLGLITIRNVGAGVIWAQIITTDIPHGQTQIGAYTVPAGETAYVGEVVIHTETNKPVNVFGFKREGANIISAPFSSMRAFTEIIGIEGSESVSKKSFTGPFPQYTDFGYLALKTSAGTASCSIDFEIILVKN
jgi:hypothetical protein